MYSAMSCLQLLFPVIDCGTALHKMIHFIMMALGAQHIQEAVSRDINGRIQFVLGTKSGVSSGEGCSIHGGYASCPYMKMNTFDSLLNVCNLVDTSKKVLLSSYRAQRFNTSFLLGHCIADVGCELILHIRHFQSTRKLPENLVHQILNKIGE